MTPLVPIMLVGWLPLSIAAFFTLKDRQAVILVLLGGQLFLPVAGYDIPGLPDYSKTTAIALGLVLGGLLSNKRREADFKWRFYDLPVICFCLTPLLSSLSNGLGWYNGVSGIVTSIFMLGVPYMAGRRYFGTPGSLKTLCWALIIGGLLYVPLCLFEIRMSPQLSHFFYGFRPGIFNQTVRYGGYRPVVFMSHGLKVALWMAVSSIVAFWCWRSGKIRHVKGVPMVLVVTALAGTTIVCKSVNGWTVLIMGTLSFYLYNYLKIKKFFIVFLAMIVLYPVLRITGILPAEMIINNVERFVSQERVDSLAIRLRQEGLFVQTTMQRPWLGWAWMDRGWPKTEEGEEVVPMIDSLWLIFFTTTGFIGLVSYFSTLLIGPWFALRCPLRGRPPADDRVLVPVLLALVVAFFALDCLVNAMMNPVYVMIAGALVSWHVQGNTLCHGITGKGDGR